MVSRLCRQNSNNHIRETLSAVIEFLYFINITFKIDLDNKKNA